MSEFWQGVLVGGVTMWLVTAAGALWVLGRIAGHWKGRK